MALLTRNSRKKLLNNLPEPARDHLQQLILNINMLSDISFADVLVLINTGGGFHVLGHARPINSSTIHEKDLVGTMLDVKTRYFLKHAFTTAQICDGGAFLREQNHWIQTLAVPINFQGEIIGVMVSEKRPFPVQDPRQLESSYFSAFRKLAQMVADGIYPFPPETHQHDHLPRVGDGLMILDAQNNSEYLSPNAHSALRRIGVIENPTDQYVENLTLRLPVISTASYIQLPQTEEIETEDATIVLRCLPLISNTQTTGMLILLRDITELRRRDRLLLTKDATIAEIHHRVKNNLQTISSLLQLQSRRLLTPESRLAVLESARRIRSIAIVHDILAHETTGRVEYEEIVKSLVGEMREALISPDIPIKLEIEGSAGIIPSDIASTLALIMSELLQNAIQHAYRDSTEKNPKILISFQRSLRPLDKNNPPNQKTPETKEQLQVTISDNGVGIPADFSIDDSPGLGLTIVRTLLEADLRGTINIRKLKQGTSFELLFPISEPEHEI